MYLWVVWNNLEDKIDPTQILRNNPYENSAKNDVIYEKVDVKVGLWSLRGFVIFRL